MKICKICGKPFEVDHRHNRQMTCSPECSKENRRRSVREWWAKNGRAYLAARAADIDPPPKTCDDYCKGCRYYRNINNSTTEKICNYCTDTGRLRGCHPGRGCTQKDTGPRNYKKRRITI